MENEEQSEETLNTEEEETSTNDNNEEEQEETVDELKERLAKAEELANNQKIRAEKAEKKNKAKPAEEDTSKKSEDDTSKNDYSLADIRSLNKVHDEDVERVEKFAKSEGITISEAMGNDDLKAILANRTEQRKTAEATNTGGSKRGSSKVTNEQILEDFEQGKAPESDEGIKKLAEARIEQKKSMSKGLNK